MSINPISNLSLYRELLSPSAKKQTNAATEQPATVVTLSPHLTSPPVFKGTAPPSTVPVNTNPGPTGPPDFKGTMPPSTMPPDKNPGPTGPPDFKGTPSTMPGSKNPGPTGPPVFKNPQPSTESGEQ